MKTTRWSASQRRLERSWLTESREAATLELCAVPETAEGLRSPAPACMGLRLSHNATADSFCGIQTCESLVIRTQVRTEPANLSRHRPSTCDSSSELNRADRVNL